ncbi:phosphonate metabolism protein/1,5-bisphosphokinase (PRPP-forming) PhnN [Minwuia thermotolerans]|uniref:Ribose 1,5-bisphosphate phosphokinase PhnN n=1 Tax=Minwuia thermotolerans TaxID=2056226 RepID=A0A2M9G050_9PROT|nr:phosphonate metabolism protein/1,5-bisphosphokinase (PRPP-forming) PhnN [Minwuia thermotolerans]PJK29101.1 phosphonate metabolism protein/1,5-bisphosphokinase (PRPP-forming) PhnN [Minwuia thermotolerans]
MTGRLVLVAGPSGVGKDSLLDGAKEALAGDSGYLFLRRYITRPAEAGGEDHNEISETAFEERRAAGDFPLWWDAHGLRYGLPDFSGELMAGRTVIANVSRGVIGDARRKFGAVTAIHVTAPADKLRQRLLERGRETEAEIERRLARAAAPGPGGSGVIEFSNEGPLDAEIERFTAIIRGEGGLP